MHGKTLALPLLIWLLSGCSLIPEYQRPATDSGGAWKEATTSTETTVIVKDWWKNFHSAELDSLMEQALAENLDIRAGVERIAQAQAALKIAGADLLPSITADAGAAKNLGSRNNASWTASADVAYELDLFGGNRANVAAVFANLNATEFDQEALRLSIMANVAAGYFNVLNTQERLAVADHNLELAKDVLRLVEAQFDAGRASALEVAQQKSALSSAEAARANVELQLKTLQHALAILLAKPPASLEVHEKTLTGLNIPEITPEQPSTLLERRPDIRAAEANLQAANADIGAARAAFFPRLNLSAGAGISAAGFGDPTSTVYSLASSLIAPIFQGGRLTGGVEQASARQRELAETYRKTVLIAFQEVEDALAQVQSGQLREAALQNALQQAQKSYDLSRALYDAGSIDFLTLLDAQRTLLSAEDSYVQSRYERISALVSLYKALGGGWQ